MHSRFCIFHFSVPGNAVSPVSIGAASLIGDRVQPFHPFQSVPLPHLWQVRAGRFTRFNRCRSPVFGKSAEPFHRFQSVPLPSPSRFAARARTSTANTTFHFRQATGFLADQYDWQTVKMPPRSCRLSLPQSLTRGLLLFLRFSRRWRNGLFLHQVGSVGDHNRFSPRKTLPCLPPIAGANS